MANIDGKVALANKTQLIAVGKLIPFIEVGIRGGKINGSNTPVG